MSGWFDNNQARGTYKPGAPLPKRGDSFFIESKRHRVSSIVIEGEQWVADLVTNEEFEAQEKEKS